MAFNEKLAGRVREALTIQKAVEEKKMMGGLTFMVNGKMCVGISKDDLMARIDPEVYEAALQKTGCREMNFTGKPMKGFVFVGQEGTSNDKDLNYWINLAIDFNKRAKASKKKILHYVKSSAPKENLEQVKKMAEDLSPVKDSLRAINYSSQLVIE